MQRRAALWIALLMILSICPLFRPSHAAPSVTGVSLDRTGTVPMNLFDRLQLSATLRPDGAESALAWSSSNRKVAEVSEVGVVSAVGEGTATIKVTSALGKKSASVKVAVVDPTKPRSVSLNHAKTIEVDLRESLALSASMQPDTAVSQLIWSSSNKRVATVSAEGVVTPVKEGTVTIKVLTQFARKSASVKVKVVDRLKPTGVALSHKGTVTLHTDRTLPLSASLLPSTAQSALTWSTSNKKVAVVSPDGVVSPIGEGTATIRVQTVSDKKSASVKVKVVNPYKPTGIQLMQKGTLELHTMELLPLTAILSPATARSDLTWKTSSSKTATVSSQGVVTGVKRGTAKITVTSVTGKKSASVKVKVTNPKMPDSIALNLSGMVDATYGTPLLLTCQRLPADSKSTIIYTSSNPSVASVSNEGVVTPLADGIAVITATARRGGQSASVSVRVIGAMPCGAAAHFSGDGLNHAVLSCGHHACAGGGHAVLSCGHFACASGDHDALLCGHHACASGNHSAMICGHYACSSGDHTKLSCGHHACASGHHSTLICGHHACSGGDHTTLPCGHYACASGNHAALPCGHYACANGNHAALSCGHPACSIGNHTTLPCGHPACASGNHAALEGYYACTPPIEAEYTLRYIDEQGNNIAAPETKRSTFRAQIDAVHEAKPIDGYRFLRANPSSMTLSAIETNNIMTLTYEKLYAVEIRSLLRGDASAPGVENLAIAPRRTILLPINTLVSATDYAEAIPGYSLMHSKPAFLRVLDASNILYAEYIADSTALYPFALHYVDLNGNALLPAKTGRLPYRATILDATEAAEVQGLIAGYAFEYAEPWRIEIGKTASANVMTLYFSGGGTGAPYEIRYEDANGRALSPPATKRAAVGARVDPQRPDIDGYSFSKSVPETLVISGDAASDVIRLIYDALYPVECRCIDASTGEAIIPAKIADYPEGREISSAEYAITIPGYQYAYSDCASLLVGQGANTMTHYYLREGDSSVEVELVFRDESGAELLTQWVDAPNGARLSASMFMRALAIPIYDAEGTCIGYDRYEPVSAAPDPLIVNELADRNAMFLTMRSTPHLTDYTIEVWLESPDGGRALYFEHTQIGKAMTGEVVSLSDARALAERLGSLSPVDFIEADAFQLTLLGRTTDNVIRLTYAAPTQGAPTLVNVEIWYKNAAYAYRYGSLTLDGQAGQVLNAQSAIDAARDRLGIPDEDFLQMEPPLYMMDPMNNTVRLIYHEPQDESFEITIDVFLIRAGEAYLYGSVNEALKTGGAYILDDALACVEGALGIDAARYVRSSPDAFHPGLGAEASRVRLYYQEPQMAVDFDLEVWLVDAEGSYRYRSAELGGENGQVFSAAELSAWAEGEYGLEAVNFARMQPDPLILNWRERNRARLYYVEPVDMSVGYSLEVYLLDPDAEPYLYHVAQLSGAPGETLSPAKFFSHIERDCHLPEACFVRSDTDEYALTPREYRTIRLYYSVPTGFEWAARAELWLVGAGGEAKYAGEMTHSTAHGTYLESVALKNELERYFNLSAQDYVRADAEGIIVSLRGENTIRFYYRAAPEAYASCEVSIFVIGELFTTRNYSMAAGFPVDLSSLKARIEADFGLAEEHLLRAEPDPYIVPDEGGKIELYYGRPASLTVSYRVNVRIEDMSGSYDYGSFSEWAEWGSEIDLDALRSEVAGRLSLPDAYFLRADAECLMLRQANNEITLTYAMPPLPVWVPFVVNVNGIEYASGAYLATSGQAVDLAELQEYLRGYLLEPEFFQSASPWPYVPSVRESILLVIEYVIPVHTPSQGG